MEEFGRRIQRSLAEPRVGMQLGLRKKLDGSKNYYVFASLCPFVFLLSLYTMSSLCFVHRVDTDLKFTCSVLNQIS